MNRFAALRDYLRRTGDRRRAGLAALRQALAARPPGLAGPAMAPAVPVAPRIVAPDSAGNAAAPEPRRGTPPEVSVADPAAGLRPELLFAGADALARAVIAAEILAKPVALREQ